MHIILLFSIPLATFITFWARSIIVLIYGATYVKGSVALQILIWNFVIIAMNGTYGVLILVAGGKQGRFLKGVLLGALSNTILNCALIPRFSLTGAAVATLLTEVIVTFYVYYKSQSVVKVPFVIFIVRPFVASMIAAGVCNIIWYKHLQVLPLGMGLIIIGLMFLLLYLCVLTITGEKRLFSTLRNTGLGLWKDKFS